MSDLREQIIRLASEKPEFREHLLPLLNAKTANWRVSEDDSVEKMIRSALEMLMDAGDISEGYGNGDGEAISAILRRLVPELKKAHALAKRNRF